MWSLLAIAEEPPPATPDRYVWIDPGTPLHAQPRGEARAVDLGGSDPKVARVVAEDGSWVGIETAPAGDACAPYLAVSPVTLRLWVPARAVGDAVGVPQCEGGGEAPPPPARADHVTGDPVNWPDGTWAGELHHLPSVEWGVPGAPDSVACGELPVSPGDDTIELCLPGWRPPPSGEVIGGFRAGFYMVHARDLVVKRRVEPDVPPEAHPAGLGTIACLARVYIDDRGRPVGADSLDCPEPFFAYTLEALTQWRWKPYKHNKERTPVTIVLNLAFRPPSQ